MCLSDTAEYWNDIKKQQQYRGNKRVFVHKKGLDCGHHHVIETKKTSHVDCYACLELMPKCNVCKDVDLTPEQFDKNNTITYTCKGCGKVRTKIDDGSEQAKEGKKCSCGGNMVKRVNSKTGNTFYGCSKYPECKNTIA